MAVAPPPGGDWAPPPNPGGLGDRLLNGILFGAGRIAQGIADRLNAWAESWRSLPDQLAEKVDAAAREETVAGAIRRLMDPWPAFLAAPAVMGALGGALATLAASLLQIATKRQIAGLAYEINRRFPLYRMAAEDSVLAAQRGALSQQLIREDLADTGVDPERAEALIARSYRWLTVAQIEELLYRGVIDRDLALQQLRGVGMTDYQATWMIQTFDRLVPLSDLTRFAIREVFDPVLGPPLREPTPGERYYEEAAKLGLSRERAEWYWMAHWRLVSEGRAQDIVRRVGRHGDIGGQEPKSWFLELLRRDDMLSKYWEPLWQTRYRAPNRLDTWRLAVSQRIDRPTAESWFMDYGYSPELSTTLAELATDERRAQTRDLTAGAITQLYRARALDRSAAASSLQEIGYDPADAALLLALADYQLQHARAEARTTVIRQRWTHGLVSDAGAVNALLDLGKPQAEIEDLLDLWRAQRDDQAELPPVGALEGWYKRRIISGPQAIEELRRRGYDDRYVQRYLLEWDQEIQEALADKTADELERQRRLLKVPTRADLQAWLKAGIIDGAAFTARLLLQGYTSTDVARYAALVHVDAPTPTYLTDAGKLDVRSLQLLFSREQITGEQYRERLQSLGVAVDLADALLTYETIRRG